MSQPPHSDLPYPEQLPYGPPPPAPPPPKQKSRALPIVLMSVAVVLVLCVGGSVAIYLAARNAVNGINESLDVTASPSRPATESTPTTATPAGTIRVVEPTRLGGRPKLTDPRFADIADAIEADIARLPGAGDTVSALYGTPADRDVVVMAAAEAPVGDPERTLNSTFVGAGASGLKVEGIKAVEPGPLGGAARCGTADEPDLDIVMCGWADDGSIGWIIWYFESVGAAKDEFPKLRGQIEKSG